VPSIPPPEPHLTDGHIAVRRPADHDVPAITRACQDPDIQRYTLVPSPYSEDDARTFVTRSHQAFDRGTAAPMVVVSPATGEFLGTCGIVDREPHDLVAEVGYWVAAHARKAGVATAATRLVCRWAFDRLGLERIHLEAAVENAASNAVARAVGFRLEGTLRSAASAGHDGRSGGERLDVHVYGLLPGELT
jgi:RimJ/RimL family protein N-acetyltransferase